MYSDYTTKNKVFPLILFYFFFTFLLLRFYFNLVKFSQRIGIKNLLLFVMMCYNTFVICGGGRCENSFSL
jgi:hypothetical protein